MSLALDRINLEMEASGFTRGGMACVLSGDSEPVVEEEEWCSSSTTSSIGRNSDDDDDEGRRSGSDAEENEVQSSYKGPLEMMEALEEVLPMRRGISRFYTGKSKSYTSLADASTSSSIKDVGKPENAYTRRRKNLIAFNHIWEKNRNFPHKSNGGGISKRPISSSRSSLAFAVVMSSSESISNTSDDSNSSSHSRSPPSLPPLHPRGSYNNISSSSPSPSPRRNVSAWRSFSVADLEQCAGNANTYHSSNSEKR